MKKFLFKLSPKIYNYSELINHFKNNNNYNTFLEKLYTTNNISESLNAKISLYLPKKPTNNYNFINSLSNVLCNQLNDNNNNHICRKDHKTKSLLKLIEEKDFNNKLEWVNYDDVRNYLSECIKYKYKDSNEQVIQNYINYILEEEVPNNLENNNENKKECNSDLSFNSNENFEDDMDQLDDINNNFSENDKQLINTENKIFEEGKENEIFEEENELNINNIGNDESFDELENEDISIINKNENDYNKLLGLFESLDIKDNEEEEADQKSDWYKKPLKERVKLRGKAKNKNNKKINKTKTYSYPKDSD